MRAGPSCRALLLLAPNCPLLAWPALPPLLQSGFRSPYSSASAGEVNAFNGNFQSSFDVAYADSDEALFSYVRCVGCDDA